VFPATCKAIKDAQPAVMSGSYMIDPDGPSGPDAPLFITCDMTTAGGGWAVIFFPGAVNVQSAPSEYTRSTPTLLTTSSETMLAYRDSQQAVVGSHATMAIPSEWQNTTPFDVTSRDVTIPISIDDGAATMRMLRYGGGSFNDVCGDPWITNLTWGRLCIVGTTAPYYTGFAVANADTCGTSTQTFTASAACANDRRFSIAVR
jgi:hypothetical protein